MTTYTYPTDGSRINPRSGMTAEEVAVERLTHDGHLYEMRAESGGWQIYVSEGSVNAFGGAGRMVRGWANNRLLYSADPNEAEAWQELALLVVFADWRRVPDAMTDEEYQRMMADIAADDAEG